MDWITVNNVLNATLRIATPLILMGMGGLMCQRAGVFNIAHEGFALVGAFFAILVVHLTDGNIIFGMFGAMISGIIFSSLFSVFIVKFKSNHIISGIAINMLAAGLTTFLMRAIFDVQGAFRPRIINKLVGIELAMIKEIPVIGALSNQSIFTYLSIAVVVVIYIILFKTSIGLKIQAVGESEIGSLAAGINPNKIRIIVILISGALSAIAGAFLSTVIVSQFSEHMIQGRGFTAFTTVIFGAAHPIFVALSTLLFGLADSIGIRLELLGTSISPSIIKMFPHILALITLIISSYIIKLKEQGVNVNILKKLKVKKSENKQTF